MKKSPLGWAQSDISKAHTGNLYNFRNWLIKLRVHCRPSYPVQEARQNRFRIIRLVARVPGNTPSYFLLEKMYSIAAQNLSNLIAPQCYRNGLSVMKLHGAYLAVWPRNVIYLSWSALYVGQKISLKRFRKLGRTLFTTARSRSRVCYDA
jgi:hypothetical protein